MEHTELLPLNLQLFAEEVADETSEAGSETETETNEEEQQEQSTDNDKIVEKLQKRIGKEQAEKNETKTQLEQALARIEESIINDVWQATLEAENLDGVAEEISLLKLKDVRKIDDSENYSSLTIFAEDIIGISVSGNLNFSSEN